MSGCRRPGSVSVSKFAASFGPSHLVYNIYLFSHLFNFVKLYGYLDRFSCFPYESELGHLKHYIHGHKPPAVQLCHQLAERVGLDAAERKIFLDDVCMRLRPSPTAGCHRSVHRAVVFSKDFLDNCILLDAQPAVIVDFLQILLKTCFLSALLPQSGAEMCGHYAEMSAPGCRHNAEVSAPVLTGTILYLLKVEINGKTC
ncbi:hypothetical protein T265_13864, partial [Opisthorchis viverrini]